MPVAAKRKCAEGHGSDSAARLKGLGFLDEKRVTIGPDTTEAVEAERERSRRMAELFPDPLESLLGPPAR